MKQNKTLNSNQLNTEFSKYLYLILGKYTKSIIQKDDEMTLIVEPSIIIPLLFFLRNHSHCQYKILADITATDYPEKEPRFEVIYQILSIKFSHRLRVKTFVDSLDMKLQSASNIFPSADWYEREVWDIFGIFFEGHKDLRRILTDYGFEGHPIRKDFPLTGFVETRYDEEKKRVISEPLELSQGFRNFNFQSPWNQKIENNILGKDK